MKAELDHAGRIFLSADTPAESVALRFMFSGDGAPEIAAWVVGGYHNDGTRPVSVSLLLVPRGETTPWEVGELVSRIRLGVA